MTSRLVNRTITVYGKVELMAFQDDALVQGGEEQHLLAVQIVHRHGQEAVIAPGVAIHNARVAIGTRLVRKDDFPLERI